jgi:hypothetical protein
MKSSDWIVVTGLALTAFGAGVLTWRDLRRTIGSRQTQGRSTQLDLETGFHRPEAWIGFPLILVGSVLQIAGVIAA